MEAGKREGGEEQQREKRWGKKCMRGEAVEGHKEWKE